MINPKSDPDRMFTVAETAEYFHVHYKTVLTWIYEGRIEASQPERRYLISGQSINEKIRRGKVVVY